MKKPVKKPAKAKKKKKFCAADACKLESAIQGFCRLHYIANFRNKKQEKLVKAERRLNAYVDRIAKKYPKDYLEKIKEELEDEGKFKKTMEDLELDQTEEPNETEREYLEKFLRGFKGE